MGLTNLGATCYVNTFLQVWFLNLELRQALYLCPSTCSDYTKGDGIHGGKGMWGNGAQGLPPEGVASQFSYEPATKQEIGVLVHAKGNAGNILGFQNTSTNKWSFFKNYSSLVKGHCLSSPKKTFNNLFFGWRDDSAVQSTCYSCNGPGSRFPVLVTPLPGSPVRFTSTKHTHGTQTYLKPKHSHM